MQHKLKAFYYLISFALILTSCTKQNGPNNWGGSNVTFSGNTQDLYSENFVEGVDVSVLYNNIWHRLATTDKFGNFNLSFYDNNPTNENTTYPIKVSTASGNFLPTTDISIAPFQNPKTNCGILPKCQLNVKFKNQSPFNSNDHLTLLNLNCQQGDSVCFSGTLIDTVVVFYTGYASMSDCPQKKNVIINYRVVKNNVPTIYSKTVLMRETIENTGSKLNFIINDTINY